MEIQQLIIEVLGIGSMAYLWVYSEPTDMFRDWLNIKEDTFFYRLITCPICIGFWMGLILIPLNNALGGGLNLIFLASSISILAGIITQKING